MRFSPKALELHFSVEVVHTRKISLSFTLTVLCCVVVYCVVLHVLWCVVLY